MSMGEHIFLDREKSSTYNTSAMAITIPRKFTDGKELVVIPREEYEVLMTLKKVYEFQPTASQKKALLRARRNRAKGEVVTFSEFKRKLGFTD